MYFDFVILGYLMEALNIPRPLSIAVYLQWLSRTDFIILPFVSLHDYPHNYQISPIFKSILVISCCSEQSGIFVCNMYVMEHITLMATTHVKDVHLVSKEEKKTEDI